MSKPAKSQWDFGELFSPAETRKVLSVWELTSDIKRVLEKSVGAVWVSGEITNFRAQNSGHVYFTLKDIAAQVSCVLFRSSAAQRELLGDGKKVLLHGDVTVYEARGQYQLIVREIEAQGIGALQIQFEKLKQKLAEEGLFALERKRPLPRFPQRIGLVTSPTGAAIRDVLHVIQRRHPSLEIILAPARVQGDGAAEEIADAIRMLNEFSEGRFPRVQKNETEKDSGTNSGTRGTPSDGLDLILITRGGGSLEDLWAFNEEPVARAIFESQIPIVSAIGHEIDFTIADFVADFRAATPSAAAEIITEGVFASREFVADAPLRLQRLARRKMDRKIENFDSLASRFERLHPRRKLDEAWQRLDDLQSGLLRGLKTAARSRGLMLHNLAGRFLRAKPSLALKQRRESLRQLEKRLHTLGPEQVLARGYSITTDATGKVLRDATKVKAGQKLKTRLATGEVVSKAEASAI